MLLQMEVQPHCEPFRYLFLFVFQIPSVITKAFGTKEFLLQFEKILPKLCTARHKLLNQLHLPSFLSLFHTFSKLHSKLFIDKPNIRSNFLTNAMPGKSLDTAALN